jgi:hypothetical protein
VEQTVNGTQPESNADNVEELEVTVDNVSIVQMTDGCCKRVTSQLIGFVVSDLRLSTSIRRQRLSHQRNSFGISSVFD